MKFIFPLVFIFSSMILEFSAHAEATKANTSAKGKTIDIQILELSITENGYEPSSLSARANVPTVLKVTRKTDATCAKKLQIPSKDIIVDIPLNSPVMIDLGNLTTGEIKFGCSMGQMIAGVINVN